MVSMKASRQQRSLSYLVNHLRCLLQSCIRLFAFYNFRRFDGTRQPLKQRRSRLNLRNHVRDLATANIDGLDSRTLAFFLVVIPIVASLLPTHFVLHGIHLPRLPPRKALFTYLYTRLECLMPRVSADFHFPLARI